MSLSFAGMLSLGQHLGMLKDYNAFEHYAALPISKSIFISAITTRGVLLTLPSTVIILLVGYFLFGLVVPPLGLIVLIISSYALSGLGAFIGFWSPTSQVSSLPTQILQTIITLFAPIFYPIDALPVFFRYLSWIWPTTYSAISLNEIMQGASVSELGWPLAMIVMFVLVSLILVPLKLDWRGKK